MHVVLLKRNFRKHCTVFPTILFSDPGTVSYGPRIDSDSWSNLNVRFQSSNALLHLYGTKGRRDEGVESTYQHHN